MSGGFGLSGNAEALIDEIARRGVKDLTIISNNCGNQGQGLAVLLKNRQVTQRRCAASSAATRISPSSTGGQSRSS